jgi:hypothetical protein
MEPRSTRRRSQTVAAALALGVLFAGLPAVAESPASGTMSAPGALLAPAGTAFTYQGFLMSGGVAATGSWDFEFALFDAAAGGTQIGATVSVADQGVSAGTFTVTLDFGVAAFGGGARWLRIGVRPGASGGAFTVLAPRQALTPAPMALSLPNVYTDEAAGFVGVGRDFRVSANEVFGLRYTGGAADYGGMYVDTSDALGWPFYGYATAGAFKAWTYFDPAACAAPPCAPLDEGGWTLYQGAGIRLQVPLTGGLRIGPSSDYSLVIANTTGSDGIRIQDTADDGIQIGSDPDYPSYGLYIPSPGVPSYGVWPNTANAAGEWALYTADKIESANVFTAGVTQIARVADSGELAPGDVVAAIGVGAGIPGSLGLVPAVAAADDPTREALIGVVGSRMALLPQPGKVGEDAVALQSVSGIAQPGDYVAVIVQGVARVRIDPDFEVESGEHLTSAGLAGHARPLARRTIAGLEVAEGVASLGVALGGADDEGFALVYVRAR